MHVYLDWNATTPPHPDVLAAMAEAARSAWANPASVHGPGRAARARVEDARDAVAALVGFDARDVVLTSGGTEANNLALRSVVDRASALVVSRIEHPSIVRTAERLAEDGAVVEWVDPEPSGIVDPAPIAAAIERARARAPVRLVALQAVNHETGVVQPVAAAAELAHAIGALLHVDAVQAVGRVSAATWAGADLVTVAAHKLRGPKGVGALAVRRGVRLAAILHGGAQERGLRPGTQDGALCAGFALAATRARTTADRYAALAPLRDAIEARLGALAARCGIAVERNGTAARTPHVTNLSWSGWRGDELAAALDLEGVAVSSGAACSAGTAEASPVIRAMVGEARAASALRISLGEETTARDVDSAFAAFERVLARGRAAGPRAR